MGTLVGLVLAATLGAWVYHDATKRSMPRAMLWGIATFLLAIVALPAYLLTRPALGAARGGRRRCPRCAGPIQPAASACISCGADVAPDDGWHD